ECRIGIVGGPYGLDEVIGEVPAVGVLVDIHPDDARVDGGVTQALDDPVPDDGTDTGHENRGAISHSAPACESILRTVPDPQTRNGIPESRAGWCIRRASSCGKPACCRFRILRIGPAGWPARAAYRSRGRWRRGTPSARARCSGEP